MLALPQYRFQLQSSWTFDEDVSVDSNVAGFSDSDIACAGHSYSLFCPGKSRQRTFQDIRVQDANATRPQLIFACDRQTNELESLFTPELISDLKELNAGIASVHGRFQP